MSKKGCKKRKGLMPDLIIIDDPPCLRPLSELERQQLLDWYHNIYLKRK